MHSYTRLIASVDWLIGLEVLKVSSFTEDISKAQVMQKLFQVRPEQQVI